MYMCFVICAVSGITILVCQITLTVLGFGEISPFSDREDDRDSASDEFSKESDENSFVESKDVDASGDQLVESSRLTLIRVRAIGLAITFFGLMGSAAAASQLSTYPTLAAALLVGSTAYLVGVLIKPTAILPFDESMPQPDDRDEKLESAVDQVPRDDS